MKDINTFDHMRTDCGDYVVSTIAVLGEWETCIFGDDDSEVVATYETESQARLGHVQQVQRCQNGQYEMSERPCDDGWQPDYMQEWNDFDPDC